MKVIGLGVGRTGTLSLKLALERLGFGPCHHMLEVEANMDTQVPLWNAALDGQADWEAIYRGYKSTDDWPTAGFVQELIAAYPEARFILTARSPESWAESFSQTIGKLLLETDKFPAEVQDWLGMVVRVVTKTGFPPGLSVPELMTAFTAHNEAVMAAVPPDRLLVFSVREGWAPLCDFLGVAVPEEPFPRRNDRKEFWEFAAVQSQPA
jgi:hypothetical protein